MSNSGYIDVAERTVSTSTFAAVVDLHVFPAGVHFFRVADVFDEEGRTVALTRSTRIKLREPIRSESTE